MPAGLPSTVRSCTVADGWRKASSSETSARRSEICSYVCSSMKTTSSPAS
jgi:hypothetical protein